MTRIAEPDQRFRPSNNFKFSPDGKRFVIVTFRGNVETWLNDYAVTVFETEDVLKFVNDAESRRPTGKTVARFAAASNDHSVRELRWLSDNRTLVFLREGVRGEPARLYSLRVDTGQVSRLTNNVKRIESFALNETCDNVVYQTYTDVEVQDLKKPQFIVGNRSLTQLTTEREVDPWNYQFFTARKGTDSPGTRVGNHYPKKGGRDSGLWLSPDGRRAIAVKPAEQLSENWKLPGLPGIRGLLTRLDEYFMAYTTGPLLQYVVLDLEKHTVRPVFEAPKGRSGMTGARWFPGSGSVLLLNTYLPQQASGLPQQASGAGGGAPQGVPGVVEFDVATGKARRVADVHPGRRAPERLTDATVSADGTVSITWRPRGKPPVVRTYRKRDGRWEMTKEEAAPSRQRRPLALTVRQDGNTPPDILAHDTRSGKKRLLTDFNPQFRELSFGKVERVSWKDAKGRPWSGALVYPPKYVPGRRHPLVIQTSAVGGDGNAFRPREFLIDGPAYSSAYSAQACAGRGMMVLQVPNPFPSDGRFLSQLKKTRALIEGAIDELDRKKMIDRKRVALVGFSNTCVPVWHTLTHSEYDFAAAIVADGYSHSHWGYAYTFGIKSPGMLYIDQLVMGGATPWGEGLKEWIELSPSFHLDKVDAAVRIEDYGGGTPPMDWDLYAILRRMHKPVEYAMLSSGAHNNLKPRERYLSQQGNVDWLAYWLKGEEDPDPKKAGQYARWRKMRALRKQ